MKGSGINGCSYKGLEEKEVESGIDGDQNGKEKGERIV
jgi:hypothetical protein